MADLSPKGMRVRCVGKCVLLAGQMTDVTLELPQGRICVACWIRWIKKTAFLQYEIGVLFAEDRSSEVVVEYLKQAAGGAAKKSA